MGWLGLRGLPGRVVDFRCFWKGPRAAQQARKTDQMGTHGFQNQVGKMPVGSPRPLFAENSGHAVGPIIYDTKPTSEDLESGILSVSALLGTPSSF